MQPYFAPLPASFVARYLSLAYSLRWLSVSWVPAFLPVPYSLQCFHPAFVVAATDHQQVLVRLVVICILEL